MNRNNNIKQIKEIIIKVQKWTRKKIVKKFNSQALEVLESSYLEARSKILPWIKERDESDWVEDIRHYDIARKIIDYVKSTRKVHNLGLLRDTGRDLLRILKDQSDKGTSTQQKRTLEEFWWGQGESSIFEEIGDEVAFYLFFGCDANEKQTKQVMQSLGWNKKGAERKLDNAYIHYKKEYGFE